MTPLSESILQDHQVRKTKQQKLAFIDFLKTHIPQLHVEEGGMIRSRNIVVGDVAKSKVILTAHYDTCAQLPFPNFITPKNMVFYLGYSLLVALPFLLLIFGLSMLWGSLTDSFLIIYWGSFLPGLALMLWVFMLGKPNPHTANDNTSGVIMLCELYAALSPAQKEQVCFVFFDNEENGLLGSSLFAKQHKKDNLKQKLVINFDCVSDGDHLMLVLNKQAQKQYGDAVKAAFVSSGEKTVHIEKSSSAFYPSDQVNFPVNAGVAALKKNRILGLYMDKIHTKHDTVFDAGNIRFLCSGTVSLLDSILKKVAQENGKNEEK